MPKEEELKDNELEKVNGGDAGRDFCFSKQASGGCRVDPNQESDPKRCYRRR